MAQTPTKESSRLALRISADEKALLKRAAALSHTDVTTFVLQTVLPAAESIIERQERLQLSEQELRRMFELLENPPEPNEKLLEAARGLPPELRR